MKVLLLSLPAYKQDDGDYFPLGLGYLAGSLKNRQEVESHHYPDMRQAGREIPGRVKAYRPDIVGLTCSTFNRAHVREMIRRIRGTGRGTRIVVGGVHASFCADQMLRQYGADAVVIGEGERTLPELCDAIERGSPLEGVNGIVFRDGGRIVRTHPREPVQNLDEVPMPDYEFARPFIERSGIGFLITSRGCPVRCTFCSTSSYWGQKVRMHSPQRVVAEMEALTSQFRIRKIFFHDDTFNLGIPRVLEICRIIRERGIAVDWACSCRVVPVSAQMVAAMVEAGCRHICWGVESGSERILKTIDKKISRDQIRNAFEISRRFSDTMSTGGFLMVGNPGETEETIRESVEFLNGIPITDAPSTSILYVLPGTLLYENLKKQGRITDCDWLEHKTTPFYTLENSYIRLIRWCRMVSGSGNRIPFDPGRHFWNTGSGVPGVIPKARAGIRRGWKAAQVVVKAFLNPSGHFRHGRLFY